jgi:hypothetical protein
VEGDKTVERLLQDPALDVEEVEGEGDEGRLDVKGPGESD